MGDYGTIIKETGEFDWEGNIYTSSDFQEKLRSLNFDFDQNGSAICPPVPQVQDLEGGNDRMIINSWGAVVKDMKVTPEA